MLITLYSWEAMTQKTKGRVRRQGRSAREVWADPRRLVIGAGVTSVPGRSVWIEVGVVDIPDWSIEVGLIDGALVGLRATRPGGITAKEIRNLPIGDLHEVALDALALQVETVRMSYNARSLLSDFADRPRPGRKGRDVAAYAAFCARYVELCRAGPKPLKALAQAEGISESEARNRLYRARKQLGLLTDSEPGKAGGELTTKAQRILASASTRESK